MMLDQPSSANAPAQSTGSYKAWDLSGGIGAPIDLAWYSRLGGAVCEHHHLLPFTEPSLALRRKLAADGSTSDWDFVVFRAHPDGGHYDPVAGEELFALRLAPEAMESAFGLRAADFLQEDRAVPARLALHLDEASRLADRDDFRAAWRAMHAALALRAQDSRLDRASHAAGIARLSRGAAGPSSIAAQAGLSLRHMRRCFVDRLGLTPRAILRRQRLTGAILAAERLERPHWADLAAQHNYSDQAHLIREARALTGKSPVEWHRARRALAVSFKT